MHFKRILLAALLLTAMGMFSAQARQADGALGLIRTPNNGVPALVTGTGTFSAELTGRAPLRLARDGQTWPLSVQWVELPGGLFLAACTPPGGLAAGAYALEAGGDNPAVDRNERAVWVLDAFPEYYVMAHLSDVHIGRQEAVPPSETIFQKMLAAVNASDAVLAVVTGDLTDGGAPDQFQRFQSLLDACTSPTFVCPGNHDRDADNYERFFGPLTYRFTFGRDGYLAFDTKDFVVAEGLGPQDGLMQRYRRELKPCRWTVGLTHRYEPMMGMRAQLVLFVDEPIDFLLMGHIHRELKEGEGIPWGKTMAVAVPAALNGRMRLIDVTAQGLLPRPVTTIKLD